MRLKLALAIFLITSLAYSQVKFNGKTSSHGKIKGGGGTTSVPVVNLSSGSLSFGSIVQGVQSPGQIVTLTNTGSASLTSLVVGTTGDFSDSTACGASLAAGSNCLTTVTFTPTTTGARTGSLTFTNNAAGSPQTVSLSGTGTPNGGGADCGLTSDTTRCGNVGSITPLPMPTNLSTCNTSLAAGNYILTGNVGSSATAECFGTFFPSGAVSIDLGGYTVTGYILYNTNHFDGTQIMHGTINCNFSGGCIDINSPPDAPSSGSRIHHLTINQSALNAYGIYVAWQPTSSGVLEPGIEIDHIDGTGIPGGQPASIRNSFLYFSGPYVGVQYDHNKIVLPSTASACQGMVAYSSPSSLFENNYIEMQDPMTITGDSCRGILMDSEGKFGIPGTGGGSTALNNYIVAGPNRAFRVRAEQFDVIHDNTIVDANLGGRLGAIHIGENDGSTEYASATVYNNTITVTGGNAIVSTGNPNVSVTAYGQTILCTSGDCTSSKYIGLTDALFSGQNGANLNIKNTTVPGTYGNAIGICGTSGTPTCTVNTSISTGTVCNTGTVTHGTGALVTTYSSPCP